MRLKVRRLTVTNPNYNNNYTSHWQSISVIGVISLFVFQQRLWSNFKCPWEYILSNAQHETFQINFSNSQLRVIPLRYFPTEISPGFRHVVSRKRRRTSDITPVVGVAFVNGNRSYRGGSIARYRSQREKQFRATWSYVLAELRGGRTCSLQREIQFHLPRTTLGQ